MALLRLSATEPWRIKTRIIIDSPGLKNDGGPSNGTTLTSLQRYVTFLGAFVLVGDCGSTPLSSLNVTRQ